MKTAMTSAFLFTAALAFSGAAVAHTHQDHSAPVAAAAGDKSAKKDSGKDSGKSAKKSGKKDKDSKQAK